MNELYHYGILGMKWGVRKNENYSDEQRSRDKSVYGSLAVKRINKRMNKGETISGARSKEADRISSYRKVSNVSRNIGKIVGGAAGLIGGGIATRSIINKFFSDNDFLQTNINSLSIAGGAASIAIGEFIGKYSGESIPMLIGGYDPRKAR